MRSLLTGFFAASYLFLSMAHSGPSDKQMWKDEEKDTAVDAKIENDKCGNKISVDYDKDSYSAGWRAEKSIHRYCTATINVMASMCSGGDANKSINSKIKKVYCVNAGKGKRALYLAGPTLIYSVDQDSEANDNFIKDWLTKNL